MNKEPKDMVGSRENGALLIATYKLLTGMLAYYQLPEPLAELACWHTTCRAGVKLFCNFFFCSDRILTFGIRSIRSAAKVGLVVTELLITSTVVSGRG